MKAVDISNRLPAPVGEDMHVSTSSTLTVSDPTNCMIHAFQWDVLAKKILDQRCQVAAFVGQGYYAQNRKLLLAHEHAFEIEKFNSSRWRRLVSQPAAG